MGMRAAVAGASGYAGGELLRLLTAHPSIEIGPVTAATSAGERLGAVHPHLPELAARVIEPTTPESLGEADVIFLALPHGESAGIAAGLPADVPVLDLGADHRLANPDDWRRFYGSEPAPAWTYGLPELPGTRGMLSSAKRIAVPGCYPTAVALSLTPLLRAGLVEPSDVVVVAASGTSGAGRSARLNLLGSEVMGDLSAYKVGGVHQHTPEIAQSLSAAAGTRVALSFTPVLAPLPRGILSTSTARVGEGVSEDDLRAALHDAYADEPFVHLLPAGQWPHTAATFGSNACHLQVAADLDAGRAVVVAAIDNLGKGAAGQAIQCANIALGLPETSGLPIAGIAP